MIREKFKNKNNLQTKNNITFKGIESLKKVDSQQELYLLIYLKLEFSD